MKIKNIVTVFLVTIILASCTPAIQPTPTGIAIPTAVLTPTPLTPTITPTPAPENLADAKDLQIWIEQYVNAYGGKVSINNIEMDANQLIDAIRNNVESFTQMKEVNGAKYSFLVVNGAPLAIMGMDGTWNEATLKNISSLTDVSFGIGGEPTGVEEYGSQYYSAYNFTQKDRDLRIKQAVLTAPADIFMSIAILEGEGYYNWERPDRLIGRFKKEGLQVRATQIIWANDHHPDWLISLSKKGMQNPEAYKDEFTSIMREYIKTAVTRYKGKFKDWVLLNELLDANGKLDQNNFWVRIIGPDIAKIAILEARRADPDISIIINEYPNLWDDKKTDGMVALAEQLKKDGLLTDKDAIGIQAHDSMGNPKWRNMPLAKDEIKSTLRRYAQLGVHVRITELDLFDVMGDDAKTRQKKAEIYKTIVEACFEINTEFDYPVIDNITTWGIKNDESWQYYVKGKNFGYPLYFDKNFNPEPAFYAMLQVFYENTSK